MVTNGTLLNGSTEDVAPTKAKSYILDDRIVVCVLEDTMTTVEQTLAMKG